MENIYNLQNEKPKKWAHKEWMQPSSTCHVYSEQKLQRLVNCNLFQEKNSLIGHVFITRLSYFALSGLMKISMKEKIVYSHMKSSFLLAKYD